MTSLSVVNVDGVVYVLGSACDFYKLTYADGKAVWETLKSTGTNHGSHPPVSVLSGCIYIVGSNDNYYNTTAVEKYDPAANKWMSIAHRQNYLLCAETLVVGRSANIFQLRTLTFSLHRYEPRTSYFVM